MRAWTTVEMEILKARYPKEGASPELCSILDRTRSSVYCTAQRLRLKRDLGIPSDFIERVKSRCVIEGDCWLWTGYMNRGITPQMRLDGQSVPVRRQLLIEIGRRVLRHESAVARCQTLGCVNPEHVIAVSRPVLVRKYSRQVPTSVRSENTRRNCKIHRKLSDEDVADILASNESGPVLAKKYGVSVQLISSYRRGELTRGIGNVWRQLLR